MSFRIFGEKCEDNRECEFGLGHSLIATASYLSSQSHLTYVTLFPTAPEKLFPPGCPHFGINFLIQP